MKARTTLTAALMAVAAGGAALTMAAPAGAAPTQTLTVTASPHSHLVNGDTVNVTAKGFTSDDNGAPEVVVAECSAAVATSGSSNDCDLAQAKTLTVSNEVGTGSIKVFTGANYQDADGGVCNAANSCAVVVQNFGNPAEAGGTPITFKSPKVATTTKLSSKKTVKKGKKLTFTVKTKGKGISSFAGKVTFTANGHRLKTVRESKTGKVTFKHAFKKAGKYTIKASYKGNSAYKASHKSEKITVKK